MGIFDFIQSSKSLRRKSERECPSTCSSRAEASAHGAVGTTATSNCGSDSASSSSTLSDSAPLEKPNESPRSTGSRTSQVWSRRGAIDLNLGPAVGPGGSAAAAAPTDGMEAPQQARGSKSSCVLPPVLSVALERRRNDDCSMVYHEPGKSEVDALFSDVALIHRGRNALIYRARHRHSCHAVILKRYDPRYHQASDEFLEREVKLLHAAGRHPGVIGLEAVLETSGGGSYLVLEAGTGSTLIEAIANSRGRLTEKVAARRIAAPLLRTLAHLHARGIVHRYLKPEHILVTQDGVRIIDFSTAARLSSTRLDAHHRPSGSHAGEQQQPSQDSKHRSDFCDYRTGSVEYMAPEMLSKPTAAEVFHLVLAHGMDEEELPTYDEKVDVWSVGAVIFEAVTGFQPFLADGVAEMAAVVAEKLAARDEETGLPVFLARQSALSAECKDFVARCLEPKPEARLSASELLAHPWLQPPPCPGRCASGNGAQSSNAARTTAAARCGQLCANGMPVTVATSSGRGLDTSHSSHSVAPAYQPSAAASRPWGESLPAASISVNPPAAAVGAVGSFSVMPAVTILPPMQHQQHHHLSRQASAGSGPPAASLHRCASSGGVQEGPHLVMRSHTERLLGSRPGTRAAATALLNGDVDAWAERAEELGCTLL